MAANTLAPSGFHAVRLWGSSVPNFEMNARQLAYNYGSNIAFGDPVYMAANGVLTLYARAGTTIDGIAVGFDYFDPNHILDGGYHPAWLQPSLSSSAIVSAKVMNDPNMIFACQARGTAVTSSSIGLNFDLYTGTSGSPTTGSGMSVAAIDAGSGATTATLPFRLVGIYGLTVGYSPNAPCINSSYVGTNDNQWFAVTLNTSDMTTRTGQA